VARISFLGLIDLLEQNQLIMPIRVAMAMVCFLGEGSVGIATD